MRFCGIHFPNCGKPCLAELNMIYSNHPHQAKEQHPPPQHGGQRLDPASCEPNIGKDIRSTPEGSGVREGGLHCISLALPFLQPLPGVSRSLLLGLFFAGLGCLWGLGGGRERRRARKSGFVSIIQMLLLWPIWAQLPPSAGGAAPAQVQSVAPGSILLEVGGRCGASLSSPSLLQSTGAETSAPEASNLRQIRSLISQVRKWS